MSPSSRQEDSVFQEPHLRPPPPPPLSENSPPLDSIHLEPGRSDGEDLYGEWLEKELTNQSPARAWSLTLILSLIAGPLAILTALFNSGQGSEFLLLVIVAPLVEEMGKIVAPLMVVEKTPARFTTSAQPILCAVMGGLVFSVIENILYLKVYIPDPSPQLVTWRWTVCVALHVGCSFAAGCGVAKIREKSLRERRPPRMETGAFLIIAAVIIHGVYNFLAILIDPIFA